MSGKIKSAYQLALEKLGETGDPSSALTPEKKAQIEEIRKMYKAKRAEREIMYKSEQAKIWTGTKTEDRAPTLTKADEKYQQELDKLRIEEEEKIERIRRQ